MSIVTHVVDGINHRALVAEGGRICLGILQAGKVLPSALRTAPPDCAKAGRGGKAKGFVGVQLHCVLPHVSLTLQKQVY